MRRLLRQTAAFRALSQDAAAGEYSHAVLVLFPDERYLRALLKECAKAFFGAEDGSRTAALIDAESYSDCLFFPPEGGKLTAEEGARLLDESNLMPTEGDKKLFVLDAFHTVQPVVQNKLLKVLEEPPAGVYFLLGATAEFSVLPTVLSRVKKIAETPFVEEQVAAALKRNYPEEALIAQSAAASGGVYSVAEDLLQAGGDDFALAERFLTEDPLKVVRGMGERKNKRAFFSAVRLTLRDMLLFQTGQGRYAALGENLKQAAKEYPAGALFAAIGYVAQAEKQLNFNANFGQCAEVLAVQIAEERQLWKKLS